MPAIGIDWAVFLTANLYNLLMMIVFLARVRNRKRIEQTAGIAAVILGLPLALAAVLNATGHRNPWYVVMPLPLVLHCLIELFVDYLWKTDFRYTRWLWPYLALFYIGQWLLVGYTFMIGIPFGMVTLTTYFLCLGATAYSYSRVRHG